MSDALSLVSLQTEDRKVVDESLLVVLEGEEEEEEEGRKWMRMTAWQLGINTFQSCVDEYSSSISDALSFRFFAD